ncbi:MAG: PLP-dependent aminotransferase family protein [Chloroflexia bacterium]
MTNTTSSPRWAQRVNDNAVPFGSGELSPLSMMYGMPDPALFPADELVKATARALQNQAAVTDALQYGLIQGQPDLISMLINKLDHDECLKVSPSNLLITNGSAAAIGLATRIFIEEGDTILIEAPSFPGATTIFRRAGACLVQIEVGPRGIDIPSAERTVADLQARGIQPRMLYTMPTFHNPTGLTLPLEHRQALLDLASRYDLIVLEDDAYRDLYYDAQSGPLPPSLYSLDTGGRVIRTGTFSKILAPGMRLGWVLAPPDAVRKMMLLKDEGGTSPFAQQAAVEYAKDGTLTSHIDTLVEAYRAKRDTMLSAIKRYFPTEAQWTRPSGGFFVWVTLPPSVEPARLLTLAREEGVDYIPGENCFEGQPPTPGTYLRLSYSTLSLGDIEEAVKRLAKAICAAM